MDFIISLVVILIFVAVSMKKSGQLDEIMNGMKKKNQNEADNVVYEQTEDAPKKKKAKAKKGGGVPRNIGKGVGIAAAVLVAAVLAFDSYYTLSEEEMAVVTTFGKPSVQEASGLHFKVPPRPSPACRSAIPRIRNGPRGLPWKIRSPLKRKAL